MVPCAHYLGVWLGHGAHLQIWREAIAKWYSRGVAIGKSGSSVFAGAAVYRKRGLPVLSYLAQFTPPPPALFRLDGYVAASLFHFPAGALDIAATVRANEFGAPPFVSAVAFAFSVLYRAAVSTLSAWRLWLPRLRAAAEIHLTEFAIKRGDLDRNHWGHPSVTSSLAWAAGGFKATGFGQPLARTQRVTPKRFLRARLLAAAGIQIVTEHKAQLTANP